MSQIQHRVHSSQPVVVRMLIVHNKSMPIITRRRAKAQEKKYKKEM